MAKVDDLNKLLNELKVIYRKHEMLKGLTTDFNIFKSTGNKIYAEIVHSELIASLFKDKIYGDRFLFEFLKLIEIDLPSHESITKKEVKREEPTLDSTGNMDLLIDFATSNKEKFLIAIENKIYAIDHEGQIDKYRKDLKNRKKQDDRLITKLVYLTLDGSAPINSSTTEDIICISYENDIIQWLNECIKIVALEPKIREVLVQYKAVLLELTGKEEGVLMEFKDIIGSSLENYVISKNIEASLKEVKKDLQLRFWKELEKELEESLKEKGIKNIENTQKDGKLGDSNPWYSEKYIQKFYVPNTNNYRYGILYNLGDITDIGPLYLKVTVNHNVYFALAKNIEPINPINDKSVNYGKLITQLKDKGYLEPTGKEKKYYYVWKYLYLDLDNVTINMKKMDEKLAGKLMANQEEFNDFIQNCVDQICELVEIVKDVDKSRN